MVTVIGGGITGLAAAFELARQHVPFVLLEGSSRLGGLVRTERMEGFVVEAGPDSVLAQKPAAIDLFRELGLERRIITTRPPRTAFVLKRGRLYPLPSPSVLGLPTTLDAVARYSLLSPAARARLALEPLLPARRVDDESVGSFFRRRFGGETVHTIAEPLLAGIHAGDVHALSVRSLFPRLVDAERNGSVLHTFKRRATRTGEGLFRSLAGGMEELVVAIERTLPSDRVRLDARAESLVREGNGWRVAAGPEPVSARAVIVAAPAPAAARLLSGVDEEASRLCAEVPYASTVSVALAWPRDAVRHPLAGSGFVVARRYNALRITACTWVSSKWEERAPAGAVLLRAFIGGSHDPGAVDLPDRDLIEIATRDLAGVLGIGGEPTLARVYRWRDAGAQHNVGHLARMEALDRRLAEHAGLFVAGSGFRAVGIPDCIADGRAAASAAANYVRIAS